MIKQIVRLIKQENLQIALHLLTNIVIRTVDAVNVFWVYELNRAEYI